MREAKYPYSQKVRSLEEMLLLKSETWENITQICTSTPLWKDAWDKANESTYRTKNLTVFRGMRLSEEDVQLISKNGIVPAGLYKEAHLIKILYPANLSIN